MAADRHFLVQRFPTHVAVREVPAGSCAFDFDREASWAMALTMARDGKKGGRKNHNPLYREAATHIEYVGLDGETTKIDIPKGEQA